MVNKIEEGRPAPAFSMPTDNGGGAVSLARLKGRPFVLYFYPRDDTPGCTKEAIAFTAALDDFDAAGVVVIGVSKDSCASHAKFRDKYMLEHILAADDDGKVCEAYGVWVEKNNYGRKSMGIQRSTFLIDKDGTIARIWHKVSVDGHAAEVLEAVKTLA
ncbi:MAG: peroxiredoxin [Proteobacteria bacterium]|nr:peroxiredoxin [Pseudomonadota bacterium]MDA1131609.1 peroxiredoxin [Pseudomonadota bacterium]